MIEKNEMGCKISYLTDGPYARDNTFHCTGTRILTPEEGEKCRYNKSESVKMMSLNRAFEHIGRRCT